MVLNNVIRVNLAPHCYFSIKEHAYLMLANEISKQQSIDTTSLLQHQSSIGQNQSLRNNIFKNQQQQKHRPADLSISISSNARDA